MILDRSSSFGKKPTLWSVGLLESGPWATAFWVAQYFAGLEFWVHITEQARWSRMLDWD